MTRKIEVDGSAEIGETWRYTKTLCFLPPLMSAKFRQKRTILFESKLQAGAIDMDFLDAHMWELVFAIVAAVGVPYFAFLFGLLSTQKWIGSYSDGDQQFREEVSIFFHLGIVRGSATLPYKEGGIDRTAKYQIRGSEKDGIICAYYKGCDEGNRERGAFILRLSPNLSSYLGNYYLFGSNDVIQGIPYAWSRKLD